MKIPSTQPIQFTTGDLLAPSDLNAVYQFAGDCVGEAAARRWAHGALTIQFTEDMATPYTNVTPAAVRTQRFTCPVTCVVERAILSASMTSAAAVEVTIAASSGGATPDGATVPWLTTETAVASLNDATADTAPNRVLLVAGTEYTIAVTSSSVFSLKRFDLTLHIATDRWNTAGVLAVPSYPSPGFTDADAPDATAINAQTSLLNTAAAALASNVVAPVPTLFVRHNILSGTSANIRTFTIPRIASSRAQARITRAYLRVELDAAGAVGQTVTATIRNAALVAQATLTANCNGLTGVSVDSGALNIALAGAAAETTANDFSVLFANSSGAVNARKVTMLMWLSR